MRNLLKTLKLLGERTSHRPLGGKKKKKRKGDIARAVVSHNNEDVSSKNGYVLLILHYSLYVGKDQRKGKERKRLIVQKWWFEQAGKAQL